MKRDLFHAAGIALLIFVGLLVTTASAEDGPQVYNLPSQYSGQQGGNNWYYYWGNSPNGSNQTQWDNTVAPWGTKPYASWNGGSGESGPRYLDITGRDPADWRDIGNGGLVQTGEGSDTSIGWRAPRAGTVYISAMLNAGPPEPYNGPWWCTGGWCDDGVWFSIWKGASTRLAGETRVFHGRTEGDRTDCATLSVTTTVNVGDMIYFYMRRGAWHDGDYSYYSSSISYDPSADLTAPLSTHTLSANRLSLSATDSGSGVAVIEYARYHPTEGPWTRYLGPLSLTPSTYKFMYRAIDNQGNVEPYHRITVDIPEEGVGPSGPTSIYLPLLAKNSDWSSVPTPTISFSTPRRVIYRAAHLYQHFTPPSLALGRDNSLSILLPGFTYDPRSIWLPGSTDDPTYDYIYEKLDGAGNALIPDLLIRPPQGPRRTNDTPGDIVVDAAGNAHVVTLHTSPGHEPYYDLYYRRFDAEGRVSAPPSRLLYTGKYGESPLYPALVSGPSGGLHLLYKPVGLVGRPPMYLMLDSQGQPLGSSTPVTPALAFRGYIASDSLAVDGQGDKHFLWVSNDDRGQSNLLYRRLGAEGQPLVPPMVITRSLVSGLESNFLTAQGLPDRHGNAHILWKDSPPGYNLGHLYHAVVDRQGQWVVAPARLFEPSPSGLVYFSAALDSAARLHVVYRVGSGVGVEESGLYYRLFQADGAPLSPPVLVSAPVVAETGKAGWGIQSPWIGVDRRDVVRIVWFEETYAYDAAFYYVDSLRDPAANDATRPDLVVDGAHITQVPTLALISDTVSVTVQVANRGWVSTTGAVATARFSGTVTQTFALGTLGPGQRETFTATWTVPFVSRQMTVPVEIRVDPTGAIAETSEANNYVVWPLTVVPAADHVNFYLPVYDESSSDVPASWELVDQGWLRVVGQNVVYSRTIPSTWGPSSFSNVPLDANGVGYYTASFTKTGYSPVSLALTATRLVTAPYRVNLTPTPPQVLTNRWGTVTGRVTAGGAGLGGAEVKVKAGSFLTSTQTSASGDYAFTRLLSGTYELRVLDPGYARQVFPGLTLRTGEVTVQNAAMVTTSVGYLEGTARDELGQPLAGVAVSVTGGSSTNTDSSGVYAFQLPPGIYSLTATKADYRTASASVTVAAGLETATDLSLTAVQTTHSLSKGGDVVSWVQKESFNSLDYEGIPIEIPYNPFPSYDIYVWWGRYRSDLNLSYALNEATNERTIRRIRAGLRGHPFECHLASSVGEVELGGFYHLPVPVVSGGCSSQATALNVVRAELANGQTEEVLWRDDITWSAVGGSGAQHDYLPIITVYSADWSKLELRLYVQAGITEGSEWSSSPILAGYLLDRQRILWDPSGNTLQWWLVHPDQWPQ